MSKAVSTNRKFRILIIDDNEQITKMVATFLNLHGHTCKICNDGTDGIHTANNEEFDVVLLDLAMPEVDGYEVLNKLDNKKILSKIIILTASNISKQSLNQFKHNGIKHILQKPIDIDVLLEKISTIIE